jgi:hypothetical protein
MSTVLRFDPTPRVYARRGWLHNTAAAAALVLVAASAQAATITSVSAALNLANSSNVFNDFAQTSEIRQSAVSVLASDATSFDTRYRLVVGTDIGNAATLTVNHVASYTITFSVSALPSEIWQVDVLSSWAGALTLVNDGTGPATVTLSAVTGTQGGAGTLTSGTLSLADVTDRSGNSGGNWAFSESQNAVIQGNGAGVVTLTFGWTASSTSTRGGSGANRGDEGALRMGIDTAMSSYTADNYPGAGPRTLANDGHFVSATLTTLVPEAPPLALVLLGLGSLLGLGRRGASAR